MRYLLMQPWFCSPGHPAQSLVRTYRSISPFIQPDVLIYLPPIKENSDFLNDILLDCNAKIISHIPYLHNVLGVLASGTILSIKEIAKINQHDKSLKIFFLDVNLYILAIATKLYNLEVERVDVLCMVAPDFFQRNRLGKLLKWPLVKILFHLDYFHLHLRTKDLADTWKKELPNFSHKIHCLPSLELQGSVKSLPTSLKCLSEKKFLIAGQIREQKSVSLLINIFNKNKSLGYLRISGKIIDENIYKALKNCQHDFIEVNDAFLSENEMGSELIIASYNLMLYEPWDDRMESSMLFESIKYSCPIIAYEGGWLGRQVLENKLGWVIARENKDDLDIFLSSLPKPDSEAYKVIVDNLNEYHTILSSPKITKIFLSQIGWIQNEDYSDS